MTTKFAAITLATLLATTMVVAAEETTVIRRQSTPTVTIEKGSPTVVERRVETSRSSGCESKTVRKENELGESKTVHKETCD